MRLFTTSIAITALLLSRAAGAAESDKEQGKGATGPAAPADSGPTGAKTGGEDILETHDSRSPDKSTSTKVWEIGASAEYHRMLISQDVLNGASINVMTYGLSARWDPTSYDRLAIRGGVYETFLIDSGDSSARLDDIALSYTRRIPLPGDVTMRASASLTAPSSYASQLNGIYTAPRISLGFDRKFGYVSLSFAVSGGGFIVHTASGGSGFAYNGGGISGYGVQDSGVGNQGGGAIANPRGTLGGTFSADLAMPFLESLSLGVSLYTGYVWFYDVSNGPCPANVPFYEVSSVCMYGSENASYTQPNEQSYGAEIYLHYALPTFGGLKTDVGFTYAPLGDGAIGYASVLDGTGHPMVYATFREKADVYFSLGARY